MTSPCHNGKASDGRAAVILWFATVLNPQFSPVLDAISLDGARIHAVYLQRGDAGRGWGSMDPTHVHDFVRSSNVAGQFMEGLRRASSRDVSAVVVFGYSSPFAMGLLLASRFRRLPVFTQSDSNYEQSEERPAWVRVARRTLVRSLYRRSTRVWCISESNRQFWREHGLTNHAEVPFESPIVPRQDVTAAARELRSRLLPTSAKLVLFVGRLSEEKGVTDAIGAMQKLRARGFDYHLAVVGAGTSRGSGLECPTGADWLHVLGSVGHSDLGAVYSAADVLVVPSLRESYGLVVREALQFGLPVVGSRKVPAIRALCDFGWNRVGVGNIEEFADALLRAVEGGRWPMRPSQDVVPFYRDALSTVVQRRMVAGAPPPSAGTFSALVRRCKPRRGAR